MQLNQAFEEYIPHEKAPFKGYDGIDLLMYTVFGEAALHKIPLHTKIKRDGRVHSAELEFEHTVVYMHYEIVDKSKETKAN